MAEIRKYISSVPVDTERGSMPHPQVTNALGNAIEGMGNAIQSLGAQLQKRKEQREDFATDIAYKRYQLDLANGMDEQAQSMPVDGAGFHDGFVTNVYSPARDKFLASVPQRLRPEYEELLKLDADNWSTKAATAERDQLYKWSRDEINTTTQQLMTSIGQRPDEYDTILEQGNTLIDKAPLPDAEKAALRKDWQRLAQLASLDQMLATNPERVLKELGADPRNMAPTTQFSILSRVVKQIESSGGANKNISSAGAAGPMQVIPSTARLIAGQMGDRNFDKRWSDHEVQRYLMSENGAVGQRYGDFYLSQQVKAFAARGGLDAALVAYNAGPGVAEKWISSGFSDKVLPQETRDYLVKARKLMPSFVGDGAPAVSAARVMFSERGGKPAPTLENVSPVLTTRVASAFAALGIDKVSVNSGYRDAAKNAAVGGAGGSQHIHGNAMDIDVTGMPNAKRLQLLEALSANGITGLGIGNNIIHADIGARRSWGYNSGGAWVSDAPPWAREFAARHDAGQVKQSPTVSGGGRYGSLGYSDRQKYVVNAEAGLSDLLTKNAQGTAAEQARIGSLIDAEVASIANTGVSSGKVDESEVAARLGENGLLKYLQRREDARAIYSAKAGIGQLSSDEMDARLQLLEPDPGSDTYDVQKRAFDVATKEVARVRDLRAKKPAQAAMEYPEVKAAFEKWTSEPDNAEAAQAFVQLTLERQREFGTLHKALAPLPPAQAAQIGVHFANIAKPGRKMADIKAEVVANYLSLREIFGPYTEEVITAAISEYTGVTKDQSSVVVGMMTALEKGADPQKYLRMADRAEDQAQSESFWSRWFGGDEAEDSDFMTMPLTPEARLRLAERLKDATPEEEAALAQKWGQDVVDDIKAKAAGSQ